MISYRTFFILVALATQSCTDSDMIVGEYPAQEVSYHPVSFDPAIAHTSYRGEIFADTLNTIDQTCKAHYWVRESSEDSILIELELDVPYSPVSTGLLRRLYFRTERIPVGSLQSSYSIRIPASQHASDTMGAAFRAEWQMLSRTYVVGDGRAPELPDGIQHFMLHCIREDKPRQIRIGCLINGMIEDKPVSTNIEWVLPLQ